MGSFGRNGMTGMISAITKIKCGRQVADRYGLVARSPRKRKRSQSLMIPAPITICQCSMHIGIIAGDKKV
jgi:hypothetical protein